MKKSGPASGKSASQKIDARSRARRLAWQDAQPTPLLVKEADPEVVEEWKWGRPVWSHDGIICTGETYKSVVKMTFAKGASAE